MAQENKTTVRPTFWAIDDLYPVEFAYLCEYPYSKPGVYAVYLNKQTALPERVYLPNVQPFQFSRKLVYERIKSVAENRLSIITNNINNDAE